VGVPAEATSYALEAYRRLKQQYNELQQRWMAGVRGALESREYESMKI
jgi:hypothetical protein